MPRVNGRSSWWVAPSWVALAVVLGFAVDDAALAFSHNLSPMASASAIAILSSIASGMIAFTGFVFSTLFVILQFGSTAYTPRLVEWIGRHARLIGHALGIFTGTFLYSLLAIRNVDRGGTSGVTTACVVVAFTWLLASIVVFMILVPRVRGLSLTRILGVLGQDGHAAILRTFPPARGVEPRRGEEPLPPATQLIKHERAPLSVRSLDTDALVRIAGDARGVVYIPHAVGDTVMPGAPLAVLLGAEREAPEARLRRAIVLGEDRTIAHDPGYALRILADIAVRALSPGVNDPSTAVQVLDQMEALLTTLASRRLENGRVADASGTTRLVYPTPTWEDYLSVSLVEIQHHGYTSVQVQRRMGALLRDLAEAVPDERRPAVERLAARREASLPDVFRPSGWLPEGSGIDRRGLGHTAT